MNSKQAKIARANANAEAKRIGMWGRGEKYIYSKLSRKILSWLSPKTKDRYIAIVGRWYKSNLKRMAKTSYAMIHDNDSIAFSKTRNKMLHNYYVNKQRGAK